MELGAQADRPLMLKRRLGFAINTRNQWHGEGLAVCRCKLLHYPAEPGLHHLPGKQLLCTQKHPTHLKAINDETRNQDSGFAA